MSGSVACRYPAVERDEAGAPCDLAGGPVLERPEPEGGAKIVPFSPEVEQALLSCLSSYISNETELRRVNGAKVEVYGVELYDHDVRVKRRMVRRDWTDEETRRMVEGGMWARQGSCGAGKARRKGNKKRISRTEPKTFSLLEFQLYVKNSGIHFQSFLTLSYGQNFPRNGRIVARHQNAFHSQLRKRYPDVEYAWMKEFQERGAAHFHYLLNIAEYDIDREWLAKVWARIVGGGEKVRWQHTRPEVWEAFREKDGAIRYVGKYLRKSQEEDGKNQKKVPVDKGWVHWGRWWGMSDGVKPKKPRFIPCDAKQIVQAMGFTDANKFLTDDKDGRKHLRSLLWDQSEKFGETLCDHE